MALLGWALGAVMMVFFSLFQKLESSMVDYNVNVES
jgi:hypothetical protein